MRRLSRGGDRRPTGRGVVSAYIALAALAVLGLVALGEALRYDHPDLGPATPEVALDTAAEVVDPLRDDVECAVPAGREGQERPIAAAQPALPEPVSSNELYDCPDTWDGRQVRYVGEVVGAVLDRGEESWLQLNDDVYAQTTGPLPTHRDFRGGNAGVGARVPSAATDAISHVGGPGRRGDLVEVVATFRRVDGVTGEVAVLEVRELEVVRSGTPVAQPAVPARPWVASAAAVLALAVVAAGRGRAR